MKAASIQISGNFGFFHWGKTKGDKRISNLFISRTEVLGILGAIIGLDGYSQQKFRKKMSSEIKPTFYEVLNGLDISIIPQNVPNFFEDHLIHRHMHHINNKGSLMVEMTGLIQPSYKVIISQGTVDEENFQKICMYLKNEWAEFIPYLGKNQFPLEITNFQEETLTIVQNEDEIVIQSLFKQEHVAITQSIGKSRLTQNDYHYSDSLKNFHPKHPERIMNEQTIWSSFGVVLNTPIYETKQQEKIVFL